MSSISPECPGRESCKAAPADAAEKIAFRIGRVLRMAAGLVIEIRRDDEALLRQKPCADGAGKERHRFAQRRLRRSCLPEHGSVKVAHRALDETAHFRDPGSVEHDPRLQEQKPRRARSIRGRLQAAAERLVAGEKLAAGDIRDRRRVVARTSVGDQYFRDEARGRRSEPRTGCPE